MKSDNLGQGLIEVVFAIGVVGLVLAGVAGLLIRTMGARTVGFERKKAVKLAETVLENLVEQKRTDADGFWLLVSAQEQVMAGFEGYEYEVEFSNIVNEFGCGRDEAGAETVDCAKAVIRVGWSGADEAGEQLEMQRFFSR